MPWSFLSLMEYTCIGTKEITRATKREERNKFAKMKYRVTVDVNG